MPYTKIDLQSRHNLSLEDVDATLDVCSLPRNREEYTDEEIHSSFDVVRTFFTEGQASDYSCASELFRQFVEAQRKEVELHSKKKSGKGKKLSNSTENSDGEIATLLDISELLTLASEQCGTRITFKEVGQILDSCRLPDRERYSSEEGDRFLEACEMLKLQSKSYSEVAAHFSGVAVCTEDDIEAEVEETATNLEQSGNGVVSEVMRSKAKADASAAASLYLKHLSNEFGSPEFQAAWHQMEEALKAKVVGKSQLRARQLLGETRALPHSSPPSNILPSASED